jgi:hypothetical protein
MPKPLFRGVCAWSITPFHPDGSLWIERLKPHSVVPVSFRQWSMHGPVAMKFTGREWDESQHRRLA